MTGPKVTSMVRVCLPPRPPSKTNSDWPPFVCEMRTRASRLQATVISLTRSSLLKPRIQLTRAAVAAVSPAT